MAEITPEKVHSDGLQAKQVTWRVTGMTANDFADFDLKGGYHFAHFGVEKVTAGSFREGDLRLEDASNPSFPATFYSDPDGFYYEPPRASVRGWLEKPTRNLRLRYLGTGTINGIITLIRD
jgi:hypothetical protein